MQFGDYRIVKYKAELRDQILGLQLYLWGPDEKINEAYFEWKYERNPNYSDPIIYVALYNDQVVSMRGLIGSNWQVSNPSQSFIMLCLSDSVTHPDHRRKGLFTKITTYALDDLKTGPYSYILNLSSGLLSTSGNIKLGWCSIGEIFIANYSVKHVKKEVGPLRSLAQRMPVLPSVYRKLRNQIRGSFAPPLDQLSPYTTLDRYISNNGDANIFVSKKPMPKQMAELVSRKDYDGRIRHVRDENFYRWRFQNPRSDYRFLYWEDDRLEGYITLRKSISPQDRGVMLVDWEVSKLELWG